MELGEHYEAAKEFDRKERLAQHIVDALFSAHMISWLTEDLDATKKIVLNTILEEK